MANITFAEAPGLNDSIYGKSQAPIRLFIEKRGEAFEQQSAIPHLCMNIKGTGALEKLTSMTGMDGFDPVGELGKHPTDGMQESYSKIIEPVTWKNRFTISREMMDDAKLMDLKKQPASFVTAYYRTRERYAAALLGGAVREQTSVTFRGHAFDTKTSDGKCLFATDHPSILKKGNQSNKFQNDFSASMLGAMESRMQDFRGDNNEILDVAPDTILIPNDYTLKNSVFEAIGADKDPATANNGFNYQFGRWNVIIWPYLNEFITSGTSPWILLDSKHNQEYGGMVWDDRMDLEVRSRIDYDTDGNVWEGMARFVAGFHDWRFAAVGGISGATDLTA